MAANKEQLEMEKANLVENTKNMFDDFEKKKKEIIESYKAKLSAAENGRKQAEMLRNEERGQEPQAPPELLEKLSAQESKIQSLTSDLNGALSENEELRNKIEAEARKNEKPS